MTDEIADPEAVAACLKAQRITIDNLRAEVGRKDERIDYLEKMFEKFISPVTRIKLEGAVSQPQDFTIVPSHHDLEQVIVEWDAAVPCWYINQGDDTVCVSPEMMADLTAAADTRSEDES